MTFEENLKDLKDRLKALIKPETPKETAEAIANIDKLVDNAKTAYDEKTKETNELKDAYLKIIKETSFKSDVDPREKDKGGEEKEKSFDDCLSEVLKNRPKKEN